VKTRSLLVPTLLSFVLIPLHNQCFRFNSYSFFFFHSPFRCCFSLPFVNLFNYLFFFLFPFSFFLFFVCLFVSKLRPRQLGAHKNAPFACCSLIFIFDIFVTKSLIQYAYCLCNFLLSIFLSLSLNGRLLCLHSSPIMHILPSLNN
jgi:hypothetical protein